MGKSYGEKLAARRAGVVTQANEATLTTVSSSVLEVGQELQSATTFAKFLFASKKAREGDSVTLLVVDTIFGYFFDLQGNRIVVVKTENPNLQKGNFVHASELGRLAEKGQRYRPRLGNSPEIENIRKMVFDMLLDAIAQDGGHHAVMKKVDDYFEQERRRREIEEQASRQKKVANERAGRIFTDIDNGRLASNPFLMFDSTRAQLLGFGADATPKVFSTGYQKIGGKKRQEMLCIRLDAAPLGTGEYLFEEGTSMPVARLFDTHVDANTAQMAKFLIGLFGDDGEQAQEMCEKLAFSEGLMSQPAKALPMQLEDDEHVPDVSVQGMVNYFRQGQIGDIAPEGTPVH